MHFQGVPAIMEILTQRAYSAAKKEQPMTTVTRQEFTELAKRVDQHGRTLGQQDDGVRQLTENIEDLSKKVTEGFENLDKRLGGIESGFSTLKDEIAVVKFGVAATKADVAIIKAHLLEGQS
jgi:archaellum component FlaC